MPWKPADAPSEANTPELRKLWAKVANRQLAILVEGHGNGAAAIAKAIDVANASVRRAISVSQPR